MTLTLILSLLAGGRRAIHPSEPHPIQNTEFAESVRPDSDSQLTPSGCSN
ncbi:MAG: hypothetical protein ACXWUF_00035 [Methylomagnum sp.]